MEATIKAPSVTVVNELPIRVREAAVFLGVSPQTVYLWVERKQIPHLRVMGRNIRFLEIGVGALPHAVQTGGGNWQDRVNMMVSFTDEGTARSGGCATGTGRQAPWESTPEDWEEAQRKLRERLQARDDRILDVVRKGELLNLRTGRIFSWRAAPNLLFAQRRPTRPTSEPACIFKQAFVRVRSAISARMISRITLAPAPDPCPGQDRCRCYPKRPP